MPARTKRREYHTPDGQAFTASITSFEGGPINMNDRPTREWQRLAWQYWGRLGELMDPTTQQANLITRLEWDVVVDGDQLDRNDETEEPDEVDDFLTLVTVGAKQHQAIHEIALNYQVSGEGYYVYRGPERGWTCYAITEPKLREILEQTGPNFQNIHFKIDDPRDKQYAISRFATVIDPAEELLILRAQSRAQSRSRLAQAGIMFRPSEAQFPPSEDDPDQDVFGELLEQALVTPLTDERHPSSLVPLDIEVKADLIEKFRHMVFDRPYDEHIGEKIDQAINGIALALDIPADLLKGVIAANHWCVPDEVEILTEDRGWVTHDELAVGDVVLTLDVDSEVGVWQPVSHVYRAGVEDEKMIVVAGLPTTEGHRWPVLDARGEVAWRTSATIRSDDRVIVDNDWLRVGDVAHDAYTGVVWCPTTPNRTWFARYRGTTFFTGNSAWMLQEDNYQAHVQPLAQLVGDVLAEAGERMKLGSKIDVSPDPSKLLARRSTVTDAFQAAGMGAVGLRYIRSAIGATDDDKPTDDEIALMVLMRRGQTPSGVDVSSAIEETPVAPGAKPLLPEPPPVSDPGPPRERPTTPPDPTPEDPPDETTRQPVRRDVRRRSGGTVDDLGNGEYRDARGRYRITDQPGRELGLVGAVDPAVATADELEELGLALVALDQALLNSLVGAMAMAVDVARSRVGAKLRTAVRGIDAEREAIKDTPNADVVAVLGIDAAEQLLGLEGTVRDALEPLGEWWETRRLVQARREFAALTRTNEDDPRWRELAAESRVELLDDLTRWVIAYLDRTDATLPTTPTDVARNAVAVAGGSISEPLPEPVTS